MIGVRWFDQVKIKQIKFLLVLVSGLGLRLKTITVRVTVTDKILFWLGSFNSALFEALFLNFWFLLGYFWDKDQVKINCPYAKKVGAYIFILVRLNNSI